MLALDLLFFDAEREADFDVDREADREREVLELDDDDSEDGEDDLVGVVDRALLLLLPFLLLDAAL